MGKPLACFTIITYRFDPRFRRLMALFGSKPSRKRLYKQIERYPLTRTGMSGHWMKYVHPFHPGDEVIPIETTRHVEH